MLNRDKTIHSIDKIKEHFEIKFQELPYINKINLRFDPNNNYYMSICGKILGAVLPTKPNTFVNNEKVKIIWLGPDEWLIYFDDDDKNGIFLDLYNEISILNYGAIT